MNKKMLVMDDKTKFKKIKLTTGNLAPKAQTEDYLDCIKSGGSPSWRNNNPGNLIADDWSVRHGAIGKDYRGKFAKFPNESTGMAALHALLASPHYQDKLPLDAIRIYAPASDNNDPDNYNRLLTKFGIDPSRTVGTQVDSMAEAIKKVEGWQVGTRTEKLPPTNLFQLHLTP